MDTTPRYDDDFYAWTQAQAALLREGAWQELDVDHLAEEVEGLGKSEQRALYSRLARLLEHLLKLHLASPFLPHVFQRAERGWRNTVRTQRLETARILRQNPSLRQTVSAELSDAYPVARLRVDTALKLDPVYLPARCPWTAEQVLDPAFWPEEAAADGQADSQ